MSVSGLTKRPAELRSDVPDTPRGDHLEQTVAIIESAENLRRARPLLNLASEGDLMTTIHKVEVIPLKRTSFIQIQVDGSDPDLASKYANAIGDAFLAYLIEEQEKVSFQANEILVTKRSIEEAGRAIEKRLETFKAQHDVTSLDDAVLLKQYADLEAEYAQSKEKYESVLSDLEAFDLTRAVNRAQAQLLERAFPAKRPL
ncbi:MAG: hypothetical protein AAF492_29960 [Verrucomicrobiota bacterium]